MSSTSKEKTKLNTNSYILNNASQIKTSNLNTTKEKIYNASKTSLEGLLSPLKRSIFVQVLNLCQNLRKKSGVHSTIAMCSGGFQYTNDGDKARCNSCGLEVSGWSLDMKPFAVHAQHSPQCPYVLSILPNEPISTPISMSFLKNSSETDNDEQPNKRQKTESTQEFCQPTILVEIKLLKQIRKRTFSHWPHRTIPSSAQMIEAGFFNCNVGDRVICLYCNLICQQWTPNVDDPYETHKLLSPHCPYVMAILKRQQANSILIINENSPNNQSLTSNTTDPFHCNAIVYTAACHTAYIEIPRRYASFSSWPEENSPGVDDLVRAGFFYAGTKTIVTCFYCNGSLQNWGVNDNPMIEHVRWFPNCAYAKQLCGPEMYRKIQESKKVQQEKNGTNISNQQSSTSNNHNVGRGQLNIPDEGTLSRYVAARLDLYISQTLLDKKYKLSIVKRCHEDQLRLKHDDFVHDCDLLTASMILQKQIECIDGKKENIIIPSVAIKKIRQKEQEGIHAREQTSSSNNNNTDVEMSTSSESTSNEMKKPSPIDTGQETNKLKSSTIDSTSQNQTDNSLQSNACVLCLTEEKRLACIPCGHLATCVACGHSLRSCPICRREIEAFVRIYI